MKQPLHGAIGRRRRYCLRVVTSRRVVDDQFRLPGHVRLKTTQEFNHLARGRTRRRRHGVERFRCISEIRIKCPLHLASATRAPADVCSTASAKRAPSWRSSFLLPGQPLTVWATCWMRIAKWNQSSTWKVGPTLAASPSDCGPSAPSLRMVNSVLMVLRQGAMQHAAQLLGLPIGLGWHTAEDDLLAIIIAGLRNEHLEGHHLIAAHRART